jgi:hypothetical protein
MAGGIFAQWNTARMAIMPAGLMPQASPTPTGSALSKEYIYADGKLVATEEPTAAPAPTPVGTPIPPASCTTPAASGMLISEFRFSGARGTSDEFVEIYNNSDLPVTVCTTDNSAGWSVVGADGRGIRFTIPRGVVFPARGHYLGTNSVGYSFSSAAAGDSTYSLDIPDNSGIALINTANPLNFSLSNVLDAVGFSDAASPYSEGTPLPTFSTSNAEYSFLRNFSPSTGLPQDTNNNSSDFAFVTITGNGCAGTLSTTTPPVCTGIQAMLGAPGPENILSPRLNNNVVPSLIDPLAASTLPPNRKAGLNCTTSALEGQPCPVDPKTSRSDYLVIRRKFTNNNVETVTKLRFRIVDITTLNSPSAPHADLRAVTSSIPDATSNLASFDIKGTTLENSSIQPNGGGLNSTWTVELPSGGLANGQSINVQFFMGLKAGGSFHLYFFQEVLLQ